MYAYVDESGDNGKSSKSTINFVLAAVLVSDELSLSRLARDVYKKKIVKKGNSNMLHAHSSTEQINSAIAKGLNNIEHEVYYINCKDYKLSLEKLITHISDKGVTKVYLARKEQGKAAREFVSSIGNRCDVIIDITRPESEKGLQIADFVSWAIFRFLEFGDQYYYSKIESNTKEVLISKARSE